jgi:hypothetical protein
MPRVPSGTFPSYMLTMQRSCYNLMLCFCLQGYYCDSASSTYSSCPAGFYCLQGTPTSTSYACPAGTYSTATGADSLADCSGIPCSVGRYCPAGSSSNGIACPVGTFNAKSGGQDLSACARCTAGYICNATGLSTPNFACQSGYYCPAGSYNATAVCELFELLHAAPKRLLISFCAVSLFGWHLHECNKCHQSNRLSDVSRWLCMPHGHWRVFQTCTTLRGWLLLPRWNNVHDSSGYPRHISSPASRCIYFMLMICSMLALLATMLHSTMRPKWTTVYPAHLVNTASVD